MLEEALVRPRKTFVPLPEMEVVERPGWMQIITPSFRQGGLNEVSFSRLSDDEADRVIDETLSRYRALGVRFRWLVTPGSSPADLGERLARRGLERSWVVAMARETSPLDAPAATPGATIDVVSPATVDDFTRVMAEGWQMDPAPLDRYHRIVLAHTPRRHALYLARVDGEPAAVASHVRFQRSIYLMGSVVLPRFRGRGLYRALVAARLRDAAAQGVELATVQAREETSAPILARLGFATLCRFPVYAGL